MHAPNHVVIRPKPYGVDVLPVFPEVRAGHEPLLVTVDWSQNRGFWNKAELHAFLDPTGKPCDVFPDRHAVLLGDDSEAALMFNFAVRERIPIKFSLTVHRVHPAEAFTIDPGVILKPNP
jgi:hypothetical protein